jgi:hypothetical protein
VDLAAWYAAGRWVALLELIDMLPAACRFNEAIANDPDIAREMALMPREEGDWAPRVSEYQLTHHMLSVLISEVKQVKQGITVQVTRKAPKSEKPFPAPRTALDAAMAELDRQWTEDFVAQFGFGPEDI